jgi:hypothetical protein
MDKNGIGVLKTKYFRAGGGEARRRPRGVRKNKVALKAAFFCFYQRGTFLEKKNFGNAIGALHDSKPVAHGCVGYWGD